jgi:Fructose/tagatose bisphosphate aldolase
LRANTDVFSNVHGVYAPGNVRLHPELLSKHQAYVAEKLGTDNKKPGMWRSNMQIGRGLT